MQANRSLIRVTFPSPRVWSDYRVLIAITPFHFPGNTPHRVILVDIRLSYCLLFIIVESIGGVSIRYPTLGVDHQASDAIPALAQPLARLQ
jgi:hypothetical protein